MLHKKRKMQFTWAAGEFQVHETHRFREAPPDSVVYIGRGPSARKVEATVLVLVATYEG